MLTDQDEEVSAHLTALSFLVEVLFARHLAEQSTEDAEHIIAQLTRLGEIAYTTRTDVDTGQSMRVLTRYREIQGSLLEKAMQRSLAIRQAR